jgi:Rrf2 family protein
MASQEDVNAVVDARKTAQAQGIPDKFLVKVLGSLTKAGLLQSRKGPGGGYRLARSPAQISLLDIIEAVDGPIRGDVPVLRAEKASDLVTRLREVFGQIAEQTRRQLSKVRLAELVDSRAKSKAKK